MNKQLSIIIPTLNEADAITATLKPLQSLRRQGVEVVVSDGGSNDGTAELAEPLVDQVWRTDKGRAQQMNSGAMIASGEYLLFVHADTLLPSNFEEVWQSIQTYQPAWGFFKARLSGSHPLLRVVEFFMNVRSRISSIGTGDQCLLVRREMFEQLGGFADIPLMEDIEICKRLRQQKRARWVESPVVTSSRRWEQRGIWRTIWLMWRLRLAYFWGVSPEKLVERYYPQTTSSAK